MIKKRLLVPLVIVLSIIPLYSIDRIYYREKVPFLCPIPLTKDNIPIRHDSFGNGNFGAKRRNGRLHKGIDILAPMGTPVMAAKSGWAVACENRYGYGKFVKIAHGHNLITVYAHLKDINFKWVKKVRQGDIIGTVGKSGNASYKSIRPHLHFELWKNNIPKDPMERFLQ